MEDFNDTWFGPCDFPQPDFLQALQTLEVLQRGGFPLHHTADIASTRDTTSDNTPMSSDTHYEPQAEGVRLPQTKKRRRQSSEPCESGALVRTRKTRKLTAPEETAKVREKGACFLCQSKRQKCRDGVNPKGPCQRCLELERAKKIAIIPGLLRPLCWRPNIGFTEVFRRGPTIDFAVSLRGNSEDEGPCKQALWKHFATRRTGNEPSKVVELSQNCTSNKLKIRLDRYQPMERDKQYYPWFEDGVEHHYLTTAYGIANLHVARSAIEKFLEESFGGYIEEHMRNATEITRRTFQTAQEHKHLPLIDRALKLWVCCRFIEEPWSIVGSETLRMSPDPNPNCPYYDRIPVPPIVDLQIDLVVINELLKPQLKIILKILKTMLESSDSWTNWFEIYLAYFILLNNVELTMAHDLWFVKRNNLKKRWSNKALIDTITQGANILLTCFHYAHQGYEPFSNPDLEYRQHWTAAEKDYLEAIRPLLQRLRGDYVHDPAKELFWTSQLHKPDWRPVVLMS